MRNVAAKIEQPEILALSIVETRAVRMDTGCGMPTFDACREWSEARTDARVPHFRDGPSKAGPSGLHNLCPSETDLCRLERLKPRLAGFFFGPFRHIAASSYPNPRREFAALAAHFQLLLERDQRRWQHRQHEDIG